MAYNLQLADDKVKPHQVTTLHLVSAFAFIGAGAIIVIYNYTIPGWGLALLAMGIALLALTMFRNRWVISKAINPGIRIIEILISVVFTIYSLIMKWQFPIVIFGGMSAALLFALFWERAAGNKLYIVVDDDGLHLPVVRRRFIPWAEVELVVFRYGIITINCLDNHLFQWSIADTGIDVQEFETYCNEKVEDNIGKRRNDEW